MSFWDQSRNLNNAALILNVSPDSALLACRAKMLNDSGYYTSSAHSIAEALHHAASMHCTLALICYRFTRAERRMLVQRLRAVSPDTSIMCLDPGLDENQQALFSKIANTMTKIIV